MPLEDSLAEHCAPTLAGIKTASLYRFFQDPPRSSPFSWNGSGNGSSNVVCVF